jgi:hypothetical protein
MRALEIITEGISRVMVGENPVRVWKNPTGEQARALVEKSLIKGLITSDGAIFVWDAFTAHHSSMGKALGIFGEEFTVARTAEIMDRERENPGSVPTSLGYALQANLEPEDLNSNRIFTRAFGTIDLVTEAFDPDNPAESHVGNYWFEWNFDPDIQDRILSVPQNGELACQSESHRWAKVLREAGYDVEICHGFYHDDGGSRAEGHCWLVVEGSIFDPTASQFDDFPDIQTDDTHETE